MLPDAGVIDDEAFVAPLPIEALVHATRADDAVATALLAKRNPVIAAARAQSMAEGARRTLCTVLQARGLSLTADPQERIETCRDLDTLLRWTANAVHAASVDTMLDDA